MSFERLPAIEGGAPACTICGCGAHATLEMDRIVGVGFGTAGYSRDGVTLWQENGVEFEALPAVQSVEDMAAADPDHDWRIFYFAPLYEAEYQRQGDKHWVLVAKGRGFA